MGRSVEVKAADKEKALLQGKKELEKDIDTTLDKSCLEVEEIGIEKKFFGLKKTKVYKVSIEEDENECEKSVSKADEDFLEKASDTINVDGDFAVKINDEGIFLKVSSAEGKGKEVRYPQIKGAIEEKEIVEVDWQAVQQILHDKEDTWEEIAPRKPELDRDGKVEIEISSDLLKAFITYIPALGGKKLSYEDVKNKLKENNVIYGIKEDKIKELISTRQEVESLLIAEGDEPLPGEDARLEYHVEQKEESTGTKREDGSIDYFDLGLITNVEPGQTLVTKIDSQPGTPGKGVTGEDIAPPEPADKNLPRGKNVTEKDDHTLIAEKAGQVVFEGDRVNVLPVYEQKGDVDLSTGNIDFVGNVSIRGNVKEGFEVKAEGNVEVMGHVSAGSIEADGDVIIHKGFVGKHKAKIEAGGDVRVKFVENAEIKAEGTITVADAAMHSKLTAGESVDLTTSKGLLVGGVTKARKKITANIVGSHLATTTSLEVGLDPEAKEKLKTLEEELKEAKNNIIKTRKAISILEEIKEKQNGLPPKKADMFSQLNNTEKRLDTRIDEKQHQIEELEAKMRVDNNGYIEVKRKVYPGVKVVIRKAQTNVHKEQRGIRFIEKDGEVCQSHL